MIQHSALRFVAEHTRAKSRCKEKDERADEGELGTTRGICAIVSKVDVFGSHERPAYSCLGWWQHHKQRRCIARRPYCILVSACTANIVCYSLPKCSDEKYRPSSETIDCPQAREGRHDIYDVRYDLKDESAGQAVLTSKVRSSVVEDEIDANLNAISLWKKGDVEGDGLTSCCKH